MAENSAVVGIYNSHTEAEASIKELQRSGFDMRKLSIVGKDYHTEEHHGTAEEAEKAKSILTTTGAAQVAAHSGISAT